MGWVRGAAAVKPAELVLVVIVIVVVDVFAFLDDDVDDGLLLLGRAAVARLGQRRGRVARVQDEQEAGEKPLVLQK